MKNIKEELEDACNDYFNDDLTQAKNMEFRHGDRYNEPNFKPESENSFYQMIVNDLIKLIDKKVFISKWGAIAEGDEIQIVNPNLNIGSGQEYHVKAKSKQFHEAKCNGLNHPDLNRALISRWAEICENIDNEKVATEKLEELSKFGKSVMEKISNLKYEDIEGVRIFGR